MAFVVEDGTGLSNANSYVSVAEADAYWTQMGGSSEWDAATTAQKEGALIYATRYLDDTFQWYSFIWSQTQALGWPRNSFYDEEGREIPQATIHQPIKDATCELAVAHLKDGLNSFENEGIASESLGDASITYRAGATAKSFSYVKVGLSRYGISSKAKNNRIYRS